jgi:hypothetical protein
MEFNVSLDTVGAGFVGEDGNEIGLMRGNLAMLAQGSDNRDHILSRRSNNDFGHGGHGYWFQGPGIRVVDNIAADTRGAGFAYFTSSSQAMYDTVNLDNQALAEGRKAIPVGVAPLKEFSGNFAYAVDTGIELWVHQTNLNEGASEIVDFTAWGVESGIELFYSGQIAIRDSVLLGRWMSNSIGISSNRSTHDIVFDNLKIEGFDTGLIVPPRRSTTIYGGSFSNVKNLVIGKSGDTLRSLKVIEPITFITPTAAQLAQRTPYNVSATHAWVIPDNVGRKTESLFAHDDLQITLSDGTTLRLYYAEQAASFVPFQTAPSIVDFPAEYVGLTNQELSDVHHKWFNGGNLPAGAYTPAGFIGLAVLESTSATDFDGNNHVDGRDFLAWQRGAGSVAAVKADGDANGDRKVNQQDLDLWAENFGSQGGLAAAANAAAVASIQPVGDESTQPTAADLAYAAMAYEQMNLPPRKTSRWLPPRGLGF